MSFRLMEITWWKHTSCSAFPNTKIWQKQPHAQVESSVTIWNNLMVFIKSNCFVLSLSSKFSFRSWWLVPSGVQRAAVAAGWPGRQSGGRGGGHPGQVRELGLGDELRADVQRHRPQLEAVQAGRRRLGRSELAVPLVTDPSGSGSLGILEEQLPFHPQAALQCWESRPEPFRGVLWSKWVVSPTVCVIQA